MDGNWSSEGISQAVKLTGEPAPRAAKSASIYRAGLAVARCTIFIGSSMLGDGIAFAHGETNSSNSLNENLSVATDDQSMFLRNMGMASFARQHGEETKLAQEGRNG